MYLFFLSMQLDEDDFKEEQNSVARLIQMLYNDDPEEMFKVVYLSICYCILSLFFVKDFWMSLSTFLS